MFVCVRVCVFVFLLLPKLQGKSTVLRVHEINIDFDLTTDTRTKFSGSWDAVEVE